jgi:hypothetical protein
MFDPFVIWKVGQHGNTSILIWGSYFGVGLIVDDNTLRLLLPCSLVTTPARCQGCELALPRVNTSIEFLFLFKFKKKNLTVD